MDGAVVTDARLSQLFDPIARLVDAYPERRNGPYTNHHHHQGSRNSTEYTHLTAYPAIIEPATYADDDNGGSTSRYNWIGPLIFHDDGPVFTIHSLLTFILKKGQKGNVRMERLKSSPRGGWSLCQDDGRKFRGSRIHPNSLLSQPKMSPIVCVTDDRVESM